MMIDFTDGKYVCLTPIRQHVQNTSIKFPGQKKQRKERKKERNN
jgi:hypothetical protein